MKQLIDFLKLDLMTARPGFHPVGLIIQISIVGMLVFFLRDLMMAVFLFMLFMDGYVALPFSIGEPSHMDALYVTLNLDRRTTVRGRYLYSGIIFMGTTLFLLVLLGLGRGAEIIFNIHLNTAAALQVLAIYFVLMVLVQAMLLPMYYRFTIIKSGAISNIPFLLIMVGSLILIITRMDLITEFLARLNEPVFLTATVGALASVFIILIYVSYRFSVRFYLRREF